MTDGLAYLAAIALAIVFMYSAIAKLRDSRPTERALNKAGLPGAGVVARALPYFELIVAAVLLFRPSVGGAMAVVLLGAFTAFTVYLLARDIDVSCGCFGANATDPVSYVDVIRNGLLLALATIALSISEPAAVALEEVIAATTTGAIALVLLNAMATRRKLGQLFDNRLPGER